MGTALWVTAIATGVIAVFTGINIWLILKIKSRDEDFREQISDFYKAIAISNIVANRPKPIVNFKLYYEQAGGKTKIFD